MPNFLNMSCPKSQINKFCSFGDIKKFKDLFFTLFDTFRRNTGDNERFDFGLVMSFCFNKK